MSDIFSPKEWALVSKRSGTIRKLHREMLFVGRHECDIILDSPSVDNRHAVLCFNPAEKQFFIKDLNSSHGTFINDLKIPCQSYVSLNHLDTLRFGFAADVFVICKAALFNEFTLSPIRDRSPNYSEVTSQSPKALGDSERKGGLPLELAACDQQLELLPETQKSSHLDSAISTSNSNSRSSESQANALAKSITHSEALLATNANNFATVVDGAKLSIAESSEEKRAVTAEEISHTFSVTKPSSQDTPSTSGRLSKTPEHDGSNPNSPASMAMAFTISFDDEDTSVKKKPPNSDRFRKFTSPKPERRTLNAKDLATAPKLPPKQVSPRKSAYGSKGRSSGAKAVSLAKQMQEDSSVGQLSDSAAYLIHRMLASESEASREPSEILDDKDIELETPSSGEKDSGVCDDKSEAGTYTLALERADADLAVARYKIDEVFGVDSLTKSPTLSDDQPLSNYLPEAVANVRAFWLNHCVPSRPSEKSSKEGLSPPGEKGSRSSTFTRPKRRTSLEDCNNDYNINQNSAIMMSSALNSKLRLGKEGGSGGTLPRSNLVLSKSSRNGRKSGSQSPSSVMSGASSSGKTKVHHSFRPNQSPLVSRRKSSDPGVQSTNDSDDSSERDSCSSGKCCRSDSQTVPGSLKLNRAFALRRARLGIDTPGIPLNLSKDKPKKPPSEPVPINRAVSSFQRNDGGRFSLRAPKSAGLSKPPSGPTAGVSRTQSSRNDELSRKQSAHKPPPNSDPAARARLYGKNFAVSEGEQVRRSPTTVNVLRREAPIQRSSSFGSHKVPTFGNSNSDRLMRGLPTVKDQQQHRPYSVRPNHISQIETLRNQSSLLVRHDRMSSSMHEKIIRGSPTESLESPSSGRTTKNRELSALDSLVVQAILQLSHKLRQKMRECLEKERLKFPAGGETRSMIEEILPQVSAVESRLHDGSESGPSKDLSNILKNLKKVEQSVEVLTLLGEISSDEQQQFEVGNSMHLRQETAEFDF